MEDLTTTESSDNGHLTSEDTEFSSRNTQPRESTTLDSLPDGLTGLDGPEEPGLLSHSKESIEEELPELELSEELSEEVDTRSTEEDTTLESTDRDF